MSIRVAFVDDHPLLLDGILSLFQNYSSLQVVGQGSTAADALTIAQTVAPDVLVMDLSMPGDVLGVIRSVTSSGNGTEVVVFTANVSIDRAKECIAAGAMGYVVKGSTTAELVDAIMKANDGCRYISQSLASMLFLDGPPIQAKVVKRTDVPTEKLNMRENQIMSLLMKGLTNREIAEQIKISEKTVKHYMTALMTKLNARNRVQAVLAAREYSEKHPLH